MRFVHLRSAFLTLTGLLSFILSAQSVQHWSAWGDSAFESGQYYGASRFYAGALELEPGRMALQWKQAEACRLSLQYDKAAEFYERVQRKDMGRTYPEAQRWLGEMLLCEGRYEEAATTWRKVLQKQKDKSSVIATRARNAIAGCALASAPDTASQRAAIEHLPQPINTFDSEFGARFGPDSTLWFSSLRGDVNDEDEVEDTADYRVGIFSASRVASGWASPMLENGPPDAFGTAQANPVWAADGDRMFFTQVAVDGQRSIAMRYRNGPAQPVEGAFGSDTYTQPWIAVLDGKETLFFSSDRAGGSGGFDIWTGDLVGTSLVNIRNAGTNVNTPGNEACPSYDESTSTLWFSSDFLPGLGGYDIFHSTWGDAGFDTAKHAGAPINSAANDLYPIFNAYTGEGWLTSNRKGSFAAKGATCCNDLYRFRLPMVAPMHPPTMPISDTLPAGSPIAALVRLQTHFPLKLYFHNDEPGPRSWAVTTDETYGATYDKYKALLPTYAQHALNAGATQRFFNEEVDLGRSRLDELVMALLPALRNGERITLDVRGHASPLARNDYNTNLSLRRIESLRQHLRHAENGDLSPFMDSTALNGAVLRIRELPFGEDRSQQGVSDRLTELDRSVYGVEAARERRIEVERIIIGHPAAGSDTLHIGHSIGMLRQGERRIFHIPITNTGRTPLNLSIAGSECDCILPGELPGTIAPGETSTMEVIYSGRTRPGPLVRNIVLRTTSTPPYLQLTIRGTVVE